MLVDPVHALADGPSMTASGHRRGHGDIGIPGRPDFQKVGEDGTNTLWVVFIVMVVASLAFSLMSWRVPVSKRLYHVITTLITIIAALSYFAMATGHGVKYHRISEDHHHDGKVPDTHHHIFRQVFYARYIDWALTTPLLLLDLSLLAGLNGAHIFMAVVADVIMILTGLFAAFGSENTAQKWGWYAIACIAFLVIIWHLAVNARSSAAAKGGKLGSLFLSLAGFTLIVWTAYPVIWGVADGARILTVSQEVMAYAVLDILAKPIFGAWLLIAHKRVPEANVEIGGFWAHGLNREGALRIGDDDGA